MSGASRRRVVTSGVLQEPSPQPLIITLRAGEGDSALVLSTDPKPDERGVTWVLSDIEGWHTTPPTEPVVTEVGLSDRSVAAARFPKSAREITVHGHALTGAFATAEEARHRLYRAFDAYARELPLVVEEATPKRVTARTAEAIETEPIGPSHFAFAIPLILPDPFKYGTDLRRETTDVQAPGVFGVTFPWTFPLRFSTSGGGTGRMTVVNRGSARTYPVSTITGPLPRGWRIVNETSGDTLSFDTPLGTRHRLVIDHGARTAHLGEYSITARARGTWWQLLPGRNRLRFLAPDHTSAIWMASFYDAYL